MRTGNEESEGTSHEEDGLVVAYVCTDPGVPVFGNKGASVHVREVLSGLLRMKAKVKLFASAVAGTRPAALSGIEVHELQNWPKGNLTNFESAVKDANDSLNATLVENGPFSLVYERYALWSYAGMEYGKSAGTPATLEVNAPLIEEASKYRGLKDRNLAEGVARRAYRASRQLVAVSDGVAAYLSGFPEAAGKVHVVRNGVNPVRFPDVIEPSRPARPGIFTVGFLGSLKPWHGLDSLAEAYALIHKEAPETRLLVVGDGPERENLVQHLNAAGLSGSCEFTGGVASDEVPGLIASMDVGTAPYPNLDGFYFSPLKILEYMAAGIPVIASRVGDLQELVRDGTDGLLVPPDNPEALAGAIRVLMADRNLRASLGAAARTKVMKLHTWDMVVKRILDLSGVGVTMAEA